MSKNTTPNKQNGKITPPDLGIEVEDGTKTDDKVGKWKPWFNGPHFFWMIKLR